MSKTPPAHFKGKEAIDHVIEAQAAGIIASSEIHGTEIPGRISAATDAARETAVALVLLWAMLSQINVPKDQIATSLLLFSAGWLCWKTGRSAWLGWSRLERLHRIVAEEKWEIENNRAQEREELKALYAAKGFQGRLLEDVLDVLMADGDRLLRVMTQEELGLSLEVHEHPLKQASGAFIGTLAASLILVFSLIVYPHFGLLIGAGLVIGVTAAISAHFEKNEWISAIVWNLGIGGLSFGTLYFLYEYYLLT